MTEKALCWSIAAMYGSEIKTWIESCGGATALTKEINAHLKEEDRIRRQNLDYWVSEGWVPPRYENVCVVVGERLGFAFEPKWLKKLEVITPKKVA